MNRKHPSRSHSPRSPLAVACAGLVVIAVGATGCSKKQDSGVNSGARPTVALLATRSIGQEISAVLSQTGSFVAAESSDVAPTATGRVVSTPVSAGTFVRAGQVLCELDHKDAQFKLSQVRAQLAQAAAQVRQAQSRIGLSNGSFDATRVPEVAAAKASYESSQAQARLAAADAKRYSNLLSTGDVSQSVYEKQRTQAETAAAQANASKQQYEAAVNTAKQSYIGISSSQAVAQGVQAQVAEAEKALADTTIRAPFDGYVSARQVAVGEFVTTGTKVATVVRIDTLKLQLQTPEKNAAGLKLGMPVVARVAAYGGRDFQGTTSAVNPAVNPESRAFVLEARFQNRENLLRPGMFASARVVLPGKVNAVFVPQSAIVRDRTTDSNQVFIVEGGKAHLRIVSLGDTDGNQVRVLSGVTPGEVVAINKQSELYDGAAVTAQVR